MTLEHSCQLEFESQHSKQVELEAQRQTEQNCVAKAQAQQSQAIADAEAAQAAWQEFCQQESLLQTEAGEKIRGRRSYPVPRKKSWNFRPTTASGRQSSGGLGSGATVPKQQEYKALIPATTSGAGGN